MKLTPRTWAWEGPRPDAGWLANGSPDVPVVWQAWLTDDPAVRSHLLSLLSAAERDRLEHFRLPQDQQRFLVGRGLLRLLVCARLNLPAQRVEFSSGPFGKPRLASPDAARALHFNVSHSGRLVLLAFHPAQEVGVDVEAVRPEQDWEPIARTLFSTREYYGWTRLNPGERLTAFFRAWTRNEAGLKASGLGLASGSQAATDSRLRFADLVLPADYSGAVAWLR